MSSSLAQLLAAAKTAVELSEAAAEAAQRASTAAAMATIQAKAALATVKLVIDLETQKVTTLSGKDSKEASTSTEDLSLIEMATEAKENNVLRENHEDELTNRQGDYIRYSRDVLLLLQHHPHASQPPIGIADEECVKRSLNHNAFHAQDVQQPRNNEKFKAYSPRTTTNVMLDTTFDFIRKNKPISRSQITGVLMLMIEYEALLPLIEDYLEPAEKSTYQSAVSDMEVIHRPRTSQFKSNNVSSGFVSRTLNMCTNAYEVPLPEGVSVPSIVPGRISISKAGKRITFQRVTVNVALDQDGEGLAVCWTPSECSQTVCYLSLSAQSGENKGRISTKLLRQSNPLMCNLVMSVIDDEVAIQKTKFIATLQYATPILPELQTNTNVPWLDKGSTISLTPVQYLQHCMITKIVLALCLHQLADIHSSLREASSHGNHTVNKLLKLLLVHSHLIAYSKDTVMDDLSPLSIQHLMDSSVEEFVLEAKIDKVIIKTNNTIMVKERFSDTLVEVHLSKHGIPNHKTLVTCNTDENEVQQMQMCESRTNSQEARMDHTKSSLVVGVYKEGELEHDGNIQKNRVLGVDNSDDQDSPVLSTPGEIVTVEHEVEDRESLTNLLKKMSRDEQERREGSNSPSSYTGGANALVEHCPELIVARRFQKPQEGGIIFNGEKDKHQILFKVSANKDTNLTMHGVSIFVKETIREVIITICHMTDHGTYGGLSVNKYTDVTPDRKTVSKLLFEKPLKLSKDKYYLLIASLSGGSSGVGECGAMVVPVRTKGSLVKEQKKATLIFQTYKGGKGQNTTTADGGQIPGVIISLC